MSWFNRGGDDWFTTLFGFSEDPSDGAHTRHSHVHSKIEVQRKDDGAAGFILRSNVNGNSFDVGAFKNPSLAELRAAVAPPANPGDPALTIKHIAVGDVFELHTRAENQGAMFQAASQFNCLEMASPHAVPEDGVTIYEGDQTQGPACSLAAGPATVYRNYFADVNGQKGQTQGNQINNLHELLASIPLSATAVQQLQLSSSATNANSLIPVVNGYSNLAVPTPHTSSSVGEPYRSRRDHGTAVLRQLQELIETVDRDELRRRLRIGVHSQVEVPFASRYKLAGGTTKHTVSQAFCSALAIGYSEGSSADWEPLGRVVLEATYEAVLWAAALEQQQGRGSGTVFLTFIGGGVFRNEQEWINAAIARACARLSAHRLVVNVCHYRMISGGTKDSIDNGFETEMALMAGL